MDAKYPADQGLHSGGSRWRFIADGIVAQIKLVLGNVQNFLLMPISLAAAAIDLLFRGQRHGERFYKVLDLGRQLDEAINLYGAIGGYHATGPASDGQHENAPGAGGTTRPPDSAVDAVIRRVEDTIVREYRKGGTTASVKAAVDRVLDQLQREGGNKAGGSTQD